MSSIEYSNSLTVSTSSGDIVFSPNGSCKVGANALLDVSALGSSVQAYHSHLNDILIYQDNLITIVSNGMDPRGLQVQKSIP